MAEARTVVLAGSSALVHTDYGPEDRIPERVRALLAETRPGIAWSVVHVPAQQTRAMTQTLVDAVGVHKPDVVVLSLGAAAFAQEFVVHRIRRRWPRLYGVAVRAVNLIKGAAGGDEDDDASPRRLIYRIPEWLAYSLIGGDAAIPPEYALVNTRDALNALSRLEDLTIIVRQPSGFPKGSAARIRRFQAIEAAHNAALVALCEERRIYHFHPLNMLRATGRQPRRSKDGVHLGWDWNEWEAGLIVEAILAELRMAAAASAR